MNHLQKIILITTFISSFTFAQQKEIVAYFSGHHSAGSKYTVKDIVNKDLADKITVINYAFARPMPDSSGNIVPSFYSEYAYRELYNSEQSVDGVADDSAQALKGNFNQLRKLKNKFPNIKVLISIGGWGGSKYFSDAALTSESREKFVNSCINTFIKGNLPAIGNSGGEGSAEGLFDGIDLDWEFPISDGPEDTHYNVNDRENQTALFALFRKKLNEINSNLLLTTAVSARVWEFWKYNFNEDQNYLDWFNVMTYDFHGIMDTVTGHHTNLLSSPNDPDPFKESLDHSVKYLLDSVHVNSSKIIPGAAFYGKNWVHVDAKNNGLFQHAENSEDREYLHLNNFMDTLEIYNNGYNLFWDDISLAPWLYHKDKKIFWTYDDVRSVSLKAHYVDAYNLRGLMFWEISGDDSLGTLTKTIYYKNMPDIEKINNYKIDNNPHFDIYTDAAHDKFEAGSNIIFKTKSSEKDAKIIEVEFFVDDNSIGYNRIAPFDWAWFNAVPGKHEIKAVAYDDNGGMMSSKPLRIEVNSK